MSSRRGSYPHPLIDGSDDVSTDFVARELKLVMGATSISFEFELDLDDDDLIGYLHAGAAEIVVRWRCAQTFRLGQLEPQQLSAFGQTQRLRGSLFQDDVAGKVQLEFQVVARRAIPQYRLSLQNPDYGDAVFDIAPGDVLAVGGSAEFNADKIYDAMDPPVDACFQFIEDHTVASGIVVDFGDEYAVKVRLSTKAFAAFAIQKGRPALQTSSVLFPALMQTLVHLGEDREDGGDSPNTGWGRTITTLIERYDVREKTVVEQAQAILEDPVLRVLQELEATEEEEQ